ncbi:DUF4347 domain-containing protein [Massilia sp. B-10]|nr:DUF4347 domain-containing protein [Massilia sp. B-10]
MPPAPRRARPTGPSCLSKTALPTTAHCCFGPGRRHGSGRSRQSAGWLAPDRRHPHAGRQDVSALHLISHGAPARLTLGSLTLDSDALARHAG